MKKTIFLLIVGLTISVTASAWADAINQNRPFDMSGNVSFDGAANTLQSFINQFVVGPPGTINAVSDQSSNALWTPAEANVDSYLVKLMSAASGTFGIYSASTGVMQDLMTLGSNTNPTANIGEQAGFTVFDDGTLKITGGDFNGTMVSGFGSTFGFYWRTTGVTLTSFTEDSMNTAGGWGVDQDILALSYLVEDGTTVKIPQGGSFFTTTEASGNNDWLLAFEDRTPGMGGDGDFQDAIFYVEDMNAVPEPGTLILLGSGLAGIALLRRRKR